MTQDTDTQATETAEDLDRYLVATEYLDYDNPAVQEFAERAVKGATTVREKAVALYYAVRDEVRYDPYCIRLEPEQFKASWCLENGSGFCIHKGALLAAAARYCGIPARVGFADVKNHLSTPQLLEMLETDLFVYHGYVELYIDGRWVKATPAFNLTLCEKFDVHPLEFDGREDSLFHPYDAKGRQHMEYVLDRGPRDDVPFEEIAESFREIYPKYFREAAKHEGRFEAEAEAEKH